MIGSSWEWILAGIYILVIVPLVLLFLKGVFRVDQIRKRIDRLPEEPSSAEATPDDDSTPGT